MSEFTIHHHSSELMKLLRVTEGDGPEVYAEFLTKNLTPYVTTQVSSHAAKKAIAENSPSPREFLRKFDELKSKNIRELDSFVYLLSCITKDDEVSRFLEKNMKDRIKLKEKLEHDSLPMDIKELTDAETKSPMTQQEVQDLRSKLATIASSATQSSTDDLIKALREKQSKKKESDAAPITPSWQNERPFLSNNFVNVAREGSKVPQSISVGTLPVQMQELSIIEDLLFVMMGVEGKYLHVSQAVDGTNVKFAVEKSLDMSFQEMVGRILPFCRNYAIAIRFIEERSKFEYGVVNHALCAAMNMLIKDHFVFVVQLETEHRKGLLTLQKLWYYLQPRLVVMELLANIAVLAEKGNCKGGATLTLLHEKTEAYVGEEIGREICLFLTKAACVPYFEMLHAWIFQGEIEDSYGEFLVAEQEAFLKEGVTEDYNDAYWDQHYTIVRKRIPVFLEKVAEKILRTGKYLNVIRQCGLEVDCPYARMITYTSQEREYMDYIEKAYEYGSKQLLDLLMGERQLMERLRSLKHYFLLDQGDFFVCFMDLAEGEMKKSVDDIMPARLEALLELALRMSAAVSDPFKDDLRCDLVSYDLITQLLRILSVTHEKPGMPMPYQDPTESQISGLEAFTLDYEVKWPLSLILSKKALTKYQMLFRHLFYAKHVERQLCTLWLNSNKLHQRLKNTAPWYKSAFILRQRMINLVQNLEHYMMFEVIEPNWQILEQNLKNVANIDGVLEHHNDFLDRCLKDCMLTNVVLLKVVSKLMMVCVTFCNCIQRFNLSVEVSSDDQPTSLQTFGGKSMRAGSNQNRTAGQVVTRHVANNMNGESFERTVANFDSNFSKLMLEFLDKLSLFSTTDCEHQMMNMVSRLDHNGFYSERLRTAVSAKEAGDEPDLISLSFTEERPAQSGEGGSELGGSFLSVPGP